MKAGQDAKKEGDQEVAGHRRVLPHGLTSNGRASGDDWQPPKDNRSHDRPQRTITAPTSHTNKAGTRATNLMDAARVAGHW